MRSIAVFGGSFDPVHNGHLRMALELKQALGFDEVRLLPAFCSPLKTGAEANASQRREMLTRALQHCPSLMLDDREISKEASSYTFDTLCELREELGDSVSLTWIMGMDSLLNFEHWYRWQEFLAIANIIVVARPGFHLPEQGVLADWLVAHQIPAEQVSQQQAGGVALVQQRLLPISATEIRSGIAQGCSAQFLLPDAVWNYICEYRLYQFQG